MNILHLLGSVDLGGKEVLTLDIIENSSKINNNLFVVISKRGYLTEKFLNASENVFLIDRKKGFDLKYCVELIKFVISHNIHIIHCHHHVEAFYSIFAKLFKKIKIVLTLHSHIYSKKKAYKAFFKFVQRNIDRLVFVSKSQKKYCIENYNFSNKISEVIYNGINTNKFLNLTKTELPFVENGDFVFGSVGNFNLGRDQYTIIQAIPLVLNQCPNAKFIFIGDKCKNNPELFENCRSFCEQEKILNKNVFFLGRRDDVPSLLKNFDAFVYSSNTDTFGIAIVEAMISGLCVVHNNLESLLEISDEGNVAITYESKNYAQLAEKMSSLIKSDELRLSVSKKAKQFAQNKYSIENHINSLENLYSKFQFS